jgi:hypothetical protein
MGRSNEMQSMEKVQLPSQKKTSEHKILTSFNWNLTIFQIFHSGVERLANHHLNLPPLGMENLPLGVENLPLGVEKTSTGGGKSSTLWWNMFKVLIETWTLWHIKTIMSTHSAKFQDTGWVHQRLASKGLQSQDFTKELRGNQIKTQQEKRGGGAKTNNQNINEMEKWMNNKNGNEQDKIKQSSWT